MADHLRIHPSPDLESASAGSPVPHPTVPLLPSSATSSSSSENIKSHPKPPRRRFHRFLGCTLLFLLLLIGALTALTFLLINPKLPHYSITGLRVTNLTLSSTNTLSTALSVNITARNPNKRIGIYYDENSRLAVLYNDTASLCEGSLPAFYQGHRNTTVVQVAMSGAVEDAAKLAGELKGGGDGVALVVKGEVRGRVKVWKKKKLRRRKVKVRCEVVVDRLRSDEEIHIKSSSCKIHVRFFGGIFAT